MLKFLKNLLANLYRKYELITCIYMFEPWEKNLINGIVVIILALFAFSSFVYLPTYIETFLQFLSPLPIESEEYPHILKSQKLDVR